MTFLTTRARGAQARTTYLGPMVTGGGQMLLDPVSGQLFVASRRRRSPSAARRFLRGHDLCSEKLVRASRRRRR